MFLSLTTVEVLKLIILVLMITISVLMYRLVATGRKSRRSYNFAEKLHNDKKALRRERVEKHRSLAKTIFWLTVTMIGAIKVLIWVANAKPHGTLFQIHLGFAIPFVILFSLVAFKFTGLKYPNNHWLLSYSATVLWVGTFTTGALLLLALKG